VSLPTTPQIVIGHQLNPFDNLQAEAHNDAGLVAWLSDREFDQDTIRKVTAEGYSKDDFVSLITREDLRRLNLRGGIELRLWREILREQNQLYRRTDSDGYNNNGDNDSGTTTLSTG